MRKSRKRTHPVTNPARSLNARRTKVAAPPVSARARRTLRVGERDEDEDPARDEQNERREAERRRSHDPECDVQRRRDLPICDCEERRRVENALEATELAGHYPVLLRSRVKRATPRTRNSAPRTYPTTPPPAAAVLTRSATPSPDEHQREDEDCDGVRLHDASAAVTSTRQLACFRT